MIGLYELLGNPTTQLIVPPGPINYNQFMLQKHSDFVKTMNGLKMSKDRIPGKSFTSSVSVKSLPFSKNWTAEGYVTEVGNQVCNDS